MALRKRVLRKDLKFIYFRGYWISLKGLMDIKVTIYHSPSKVFTIGGIKNYPAITCLKKITQPRSEIISLRWLGSLIKKTNLKIRTQI